MASNIRRLLYWLNENGEKPVIILCVVSALFLIPYQVFARYILGSWFGIPVDTAMVEELALYSLIWGTYFSVPLVIRRRQNIRITPFIDYCIPKRYHNFFLMLNNIATFALTFVIFLLSIRLLRLQWQFPQITATLRIPYYFPYSVLFFGFFCMTIRVVQDTIKLVHETNIKTFMAALACGIVLVSPIYFFNLNTAFTLFGTLLISMFLGISIAISLGISGIITIIVSGFLPLNIVAQTTYNTLDSFPMLAVFLFILAGIFMGKGGLSAQLINLADVLIGRFSGGLAMATILACTFFGAISGSGIATVAAIGMIAIPAMIAHGYPAAFAGAVTASAAVIGVMIPPSNPFVLFGAITQVSIGKLFLGGVGPGLLTCFLLCFTAWLISKKNNWRGSDKRYNWKQIVALCWESKWALMVPIIILGGIYGGIMTPTEAAGVAALYGFCVSIFVLKGITRKNIIEVLIDSAVTSATVLFIVAMSSIFGYILAIEQIPDSIAKWMLTISGNKYVLLIFVNILLLIAGAVMESASATIILGTILLPVMVSVGVDPVHFGVILVCNLAIGFTTPPLGQTLFVASAITEEKTAAIAYASLPFIIAMIFMILLITYFPPIVLYLTRFI